MPPAYLLGRATGIATPSETSVPVGLNPTQFRHASGFDQVGSAGFGQSSSLNTIPPEVLGVYASGIAWNSSFFNYLQTSGLGSAQLGYRLLGGANQLAPLPWTDITTLSVVFNQDISVNTAAAGLALLGSPNLPAPPSLAKATITFDGATHTVRWTFDSPLAVDKYLLSIPSRAVTNSLGLTLDGEWTNAIGQSPASQFPSGDGVVGGDFNLRFNVLPGDVDQTGVVTAADADGVHGHLLQDIATATYSPFADLNGDGVITGLDGSLLRMNWLQSLPDTDPTAPTASIMAVSPSPRNSAVSQMQFAFSEVVSGVSLSALSLSKNGGANLLTSAQTLTTSDNVTYTLGNLSSLTGSTGSYALTLTAAASDITDSAGNALAVSATRSFAVDVTAPTVSITSVTPNPHSSAVSQMQFVISEAVSGVTLSALSLTVNGGANLLTSAQTLTTSDNITYTLGNLSSPTGSSGNYTLTLTAAGSGIVDSVGNALAGDATSNFVVNLTQSSPGPTSFLPGPNTYSADPAAMAVSGQVDTTTSGNVLVVFGTTGTDAIILSESGTSITVATSTGNQTFAGPYVGIAVYGFGGGDTIRLDHTIAAGITSVVYGGAGGNTISDAGPDTAYLFAGSGNDKIITIGGGADHLYGGSGLDSFWYDSADSLTGSTAAETAAQSIHAVTAFVQPTSSSTITLEVDGQPLPEPASPYAYTSNFANHPLFSGTPQFNDPRQGVLDDCYFLAGLSALADTDPGLIQQSIAALGDGSYAVRFYMNGTPTYYHIDGQLPTNGSSPAYDQLTPSGALWVSLLEKAFAQFRRGQNSYRSLNFGIMDEAYTGLTGAYYGFAFTASSTADALAQSMANSLAAGNAVTAASNNPSSAPIVSSHAYNVHAVTFENGAWYVTVYNPWGFDGASFDSNPSDGLLTLTASQFQTCFQVVETNNA